MKQKKYIYFFVKNKQTIIIGLTCQKRTGKKKNRYKKEQKQDLYIGQFGVFL